MTRQTIEEASNRGILKGRVALVTGAGSGIGLATALAFARRGAAVTAVDIDERTADSAAEAITAAGGVAMAILCDVSDERSVIAMIRATIGRFGRLDCAHNNAGIEQQRASTVECTDQNWNRTVDTNLKGTWLCMKHEIPCLLRTDAGAIVNSSSIAGLVGARGASAYTASKHGIVGLTRATALELAPQGVRVNAICPGYIRTPLNDRVIAREPEPEQRYISTTPLGRMGTADEVAEAVVWLCSPSASFVTGVALPVDGGLAAQ